MPINFLDESIRKLRKILVYILVLSLFINLFMLTVPLYMMQVFDRVLASHSTDTLIYLTAIALFILSIFTALDVIRNKVGISIADWLESSLSTRALCYSPDVILSGHSYGGQALQDIGAIKQFCASPSMFSLFDLPWMPFYLVLMFLLHPALGVVTFIGIALFIALAIFNDLITKKSFQKANNLSIKIRRSTASILKSSDVIQAMGMMGHVIKRWFNMNKDLQNFQSQSSNKTATIIACSKGFRLGLQILILAVGAYYVLQNEISPGTMIAASILMGRALAPVEGAIGNWKQVLAVKEAYKRLHFYFEYERQQDLQELIDYPVSKGKLTCQNLVYIPPNSNLPTIKQINLEVEPASILAIIGPTAAGKSTLAKLLVGSLAAKAGDVRLDGIDLYKWSRMQIGSNIGYLPQEINLFDGTIKDNIVRLADCNDEWLIKAAKMADVYEFILKLPSGFDTVIGLNGIELSTGQKQKVALARALYGAPQLIVLDEPAANLDIHGESALKNTLALLKKSGATVVLITHHPSLMSDVDNILVLNNGMCQHFGPKQKVLKALQSSSPTNKELPNEPL